MSKNKKFCIKVIRINYNSFIVNNTHCDYIQLINWFKDIIAL